MRTGPVPCSLLASLHDYDDTTHSGASLRRTKTQGVLPTPEAILTVLWGTLASGGMRLRKVHGYRTMSTMPLRQAA